MSISHNRCIATLQLPGTVWIGSAPIEPVRRLASGIPSLDALLDGGLPRGSLSEFVGTPSCGCATLMSMLLAASTRRGELTAVIDLPGTLHPAALLAVGTELDRVLWVRPPSLQTSLKCTELVLAAGGFGLVVLDLGLLNVHRLPLHVWPRLVRVAKRAGTALVILAPRRIAGSFATISVNLTLRRVRWSHGSWRLFEGLTAHALVARNKLGVPGRVLELELGTRGLGSVLVPGP